MSFPRGCERNHTAVVRRAHALQDGLERPRRFASVTRPNWAKVAPRGVRWVLYGGWISDDG